MLTEKEREEYREAVEKGRKALIAMEFLKEYLTRTRALLFNEMETMPDLGNSATLIMFLRVLREFENSVVRYIDTGKVSERRLNEDGE